MGKWVHAFLCSVNVKWTQTTVSRVWTRFFEFILSVFIHYTTRISCLYKGFLILVFSVKDVRKHNPIWHTSSINHYNYPKQNYAIYFCIDLCIMIHMHIHTHAYIYIYICINSQKFIHFIKISAFVENMIYKLNTAFFSWCLIFTACQPA